MFLSKYFIMSSKSRLFITFGLVFVLLAVFSRYSLSFSEKNLFIKGGYAVNNKEINIKPKISCVNDEPINVATITIDEDLDNDEESIGNDERIEKIKSMWKERIYSHNQTHIMDVLENINEPYITYQTLKNDPILMFKQILQQLLFPMRTSKHQVKWLDQAFAVHVKGIAAIATNKHLVSEEALKFLPPLSRGVHLLGSSKLTRMMKYSLVEALAASIGAKLVIVNQDTIETLRQLALKEPIITPKDILTDETLVSALLDLAEEEDTPYIITFDDDLTWIKENAEISRLIGSDMTNDDSRVFYVVLDPSETVSDGRSINNFISAGINTASKQPSSNDDMTASSPGFPDMSTNPSMLPWQQNQPLTFPNMPPAVGRSFQVIMHKNGSTSMIALPPSMMPPPGTLPMRPPDAVMKRIMQEQQKKLQRRNMDIDNNINADDIDHEANEETKFPPPPFPFLSPDMTEEEMQDFLRDPDNQPIIKDFMDKIIAMIAESLPPGMQRPPEGMDFKVNMMQVPMPPSMMNMPWSKQMQQKIQEEREKREQAKKSGEDHVNDGETQKSSGFSRFPGFMRSISRRKKNDTKSTKTDVNSTSTSNHNINANTTHPSSATSSPSIEDEVVDIMPLFENVKIASPADHTTRTLWDQLLEDELATRIEARNFDMMRSALTASGVDFKADALSCLNDSLRITAMSKDEAKAVITTAIKYEVARMKSYAWNASLSIEQQRIQVSSSSLIAAIEHQLRIPATSNDKKNSKASSGIALNKQDLNNIVTDKHERLLLANVMFPQDIGVSYDMIGGLTAVKELLRQCITYPLKYPRLYREGIANEAVKGVLLFGPPGTGKTMLAKAVATEGGASFLSIDASSIENKWLGESEKNARAVFTLARRIAPCVVFIDEVDSLLSSREYGDDSTHGTITSVKTTLMQEWDGLRTTKDRVVVIASTNRPFDLDEAVLRRLPRRIMVDLPDRATREDVLRVTLANNRMAADVNYTRIADMLEGYSGSDIKEICREAVVRIAHEKALILDRGSSSDDHAMLAAASIDEYLEPLRPVEFKDFKEAIRKLKASVSENSRELQKIVDWNDKYGEMKKEKRRKGAVSMYI